MARDFLVAIRQPFPFKHRSAKESQNLEFVALCHPARPAHSTMPALDEAGEPKSDRNGHSPTCFSWMELGGNDEVGYTPTPLLAMATFLLPLDNSCLRSTIRSGADSLALAAWVWPE